MADVIQQVPDTQNILPRRWKDMGDGTFAEVVSANNAVSTAQAGVSSNNSVGVASGAIIPAGTYKQWVTIQNTHATQKLYLSFNNPATSADITLQPGASITIPFGPTNALYALGSGAGTTYAIVGA